MILDYAYGGNDHGRRNTKVFGASTLTYREKEGDQELVT